MIRNAFARLASIHPGYLHRAAALAAAALLSAGLVVAPARAAVVAFDSFPADASNRGDTFGPGWLLGAVGVYFHAAVSGPISRVIAQMGTDQPPSIVELALYQWAPGDATPPAPELDRSTGVTLTGGSVAQEFTGWGGYSLVEGTSYAIIATVVDGSSGFWTYGADRDGAGGVFLLGSDWYADKLTSAMRVEVAPIPVPAALPLMMSALAGLGLIARRRRRV